jgi:hypothetical protein
VASRASLRTSAIERALWPVLAVLGAMVVLHRPDGGEVAVAPGQVTALHAKAPLPHTNKLSSAEARCTLWLADGKILSVIEPCEAVKQLLEAAR